MEAVKLTQQFKELGHQIPCGHDSSGLRCPDFKLLNSLSFLPASSSLWTHPHILISQSRLSHPDVVSWKPHHVDLS